MKTLTLVASTLLVAALSAGCANHSHVEDHFGESYHTLKAQQIANPDAGKEVQTVDGMNSATARDVTATYHFRQAEQSKVQNDDSLLDIIGSD